MKIHIRDASWLCVMMLPVSLSATRGVMSRFGLVLREKKIQINKKKWSARFQERKIRTNKKRSVRFQAIFPTKSEPNQLDQNRVGSIQVNRVQHVWCGFFTWKVMGSFLTTKQKKMKEKQQKFDADLKERTVVVENEQSR